MSFHIIADNSWRDKLYNDYIIGKFFESCIKLNWNTNVCYCKTG